MFTIYLFESVKNNVLFVGYGEDFVLVCVESLDLCVSLSHSPLLLEWNPNIGPAVIYSSPEYISFLK